MKLLPLFVLTACAPSLVDEAPDPDVQVEDDTSGEETPSELVEQELPDGSLVGVLDATSESEAVLVDLDGAAFAEGAYWDLSFQRFEVRVNGGVSGEGAVEATFVEGVAFEDAEAPSEPWLVDAEDPDEETSGLVFGDWYDYDFATHTLTAKDRVYFVRTTDDAVFKVALLDYYADAGTPGTVEWRWIEVAP